MKYKYIEAIDAQEVVHQKAHSSPGEMRTMLASLTTAIPGMLYVGGKHLLDKKEVRDLVEVLQYWLLTGNLDSPALQDPNEKPDDTY